MRFLAELARRYVDAPRNAPRPPVARHVSATSSSPNGLSDYVDLIAESRTHAQARRFGRSLALISERLAKSPNDRELLHARALTLLEWGRLRESLRDFRAVEASGLRSSALQVSMAEACHQLGFAEHAERHARAAIALDETNAAAYFGLAAVLQGAGRFNEAIRSYEKAYELAPSRVEALTFIAACKVVQKDAAAELSVRRAMGIDGGDQALTWSLLAIALAQQGRDREALLAFARAEEIESRTGQEADTFVAHGHHLLKCGHVPEAIALFEARLASQPHPSGHAHYGLALLTAGRYREGWQQYEFRWSDQKLGSMRPRFSKPQWSGQDLAGKTLLIWLEQGYGDTIQSARFAQVLCARGARILFLVPMAIEALAKDFLGVDRVITQLDDKEPFDYQIGAMSLPQALGVTLHDIPGSVPYVKVEPTNAAQWRTRFGFDSKLKVGIAWAGNPIHQNDRYRSLPASALTPLLGTPGVQFFSLQKERRQGDDAWLPVGSTLIDLSPELHDFRDTAAAINALDLVISVDTVVAHLAGALGKPCWLLLPSNADFRWLREGQRSPWYPTMRLFRQQRLGDWEQVIDRIRDSLSEAITCGATSGSFAALLPPAEVFSTAKPERTDETGRPAQLSQLAYTRYGLIQYSPRQEIAARSLEYYGEWLQQQLAVVSSLLRSRAVIVEAGSGIGAHALGLAQMVGTEGHLIAYEKDPYLRRILVQNLQLNKIGSGIVTVIQGELTGPRGAGPTAQALDDDEICDRIDDLGLGRLDLIKVNDAAVSLKIIEGAAQTLWRLRPLLLLAAHGPLDLHHLALRTRDFGYRCWSMVVPLFNRDNFNRREEDILDGAKVLTLVAVPEESAIPIALKDYAELSSESVS